MLTRSLGLALAIALSGVAATAALPEGSSPHAATEATRYDFGVVKRGEAVRHTFELENAGESRLVIEKAEMKDAALSAQVPRVVLPGSQGSLALELATDHVRGEISAAAVVHTNDPARPRISFELSGTVEWPIDIRPLPAAFLSAFEGEPKALELTIVNNEVEALEIFGLETESTRFEASLDTVREGREYRLVVAMNPETPPGLYQETLEMLTNRIDADRKINIPVNLLVKSGLHADPEKIDFGAVRIAELEESTELREMLTQSIFLSASSGDAFEVDVFEEMPFARVIKTPDGPNTTFRFDVTLDPSAMQPGEFSGALRFVTDDPLLPEAVIPVRGVAR